LLSFGFAERVPYRVAPIYLIRLAGAPFDVIERLATPQTNEAARALGAGKAGAIDLNRLSEGKARLEKILQRELEKSRRALLDSARTILPRYSIFSTEGMRDRILTLTESHTGDALAPRNSRNRES